MKLNGNWKQGIYLSSGHGDVLTKCSISALRNNEQYHTEWSLIAKFRCGIIPLRVETGFYRNEPLQEHCCVLCTERSIVLYWGWKRFFLIGSTKTKKLFLSMGKCR